MKDIARELNLSITTVSFVLNGKTNSISPATIKKVKDLIRKRGYNPNSAARNLRTGKSKTIGLIVEDISNYFFGYIAKVIEREAHKNDYNIFYSSTESNNETAISLITKMKSSSVDGLIITATPGLKDEILKLNNERIPFVLIDRLIPGIESNYVIIDNYKGAYNLARHLLDNNYRKIGFVSITEGMSQMIDRKKGFMDAMTDYKIRVRPKTVLEVPFSDGDKNSVAIANYLIKNPDLDAIFFSTNYLGVIGIEALQLQKRKIPQDIAVVCFDDNDLFRLMAPSITVAAQPMNELAIQSIYLLLKMIKKAKPNRLPEKVTLEPTLIIRNSSPLKIKKSSRV
ncbi:MAG: LacI family DNA-binding transcriptional regulator [Flavitalea sp.]